MCMFMHIIHYERRFKMAFNKKIDSNDQENSIEKALENAVSPNTSYKKIEIKKDKIKEKKKRYQFMLQPSVRKKLDELVEENNYSSSSEFLNEIIKQLYVN